MKKFNTLMFRDTRNTLTRQQLRRNRRARRLYGSAVMLLILCAALTVPALAAGSDPLTIVNNLSDFIFSCIKAVGVIILGWGIVQLGIGACIEGAIIVLACLIFSAFAASSPPVLDTSLSAVTMSWQYVAETIFNMLVLVALVKGAERIVKEMFGL